MIRLSIASVLVVTRRFRGIETRDRVTKVGKRNVSDIGASVECLVLRGVPVGDVLDLERGVGTGVNRIRGIRNGNTSMARVQVVEGISVNQQVEVAVRSWVCALLSAFSLSRLALGLHTL